jgi:SAM-dependent methyltransferase
MKKYAITAYRLVKQLVADPSKQLRNWRALPTYLRNASTWMRANSDDVFRVRVTDLHPVLQDRFASAGTARGHYFLQDLWVAQQLYRLGVDEHTDVGSRIDGFVSHLLTLLIDVTYVDIRPLSSSLNSLQFVQGTLTDLPFETGSLHTLSSLHVLEHVGLGRYGDLVEPDGYMAAARELSRVLAPGGHLFVSVPVGRERLCFDAHRVFSSKRILQIFDSLTLEEFALINDEGTVVNEEAEISDADSCEYGCGIFHFRKEVGKG